MGGGTKNPFLGWTQRLEKKFNWTPPHHPNLPMFFPCKIFYQYPKCTTFMMNSSFLLFPMHYSKTEPVNKIIFVLSRVCWSRNIVCLLTTFTIIQSQRENFLFVLWLGFIGHCQAQPKLHLSSDLCPISSLTHSMADSQKVGNLGTYFWKRRWK